MKIWNYIVIYATLAIFLTLAGIQIPIFLTILEYTGLVEIDSLSGAIAWTYNENNSFYLVIIATLGLATGLGIVATLLSRSSPENYIINIGMLTTAGAGILLFAPVSYAIIKQGFSYSVWIGSLTLLIFGPLGIGFLAALYEHFRGTD